MEAARPHRVWVRLLTVLVGILTVLAILTTWVDRQVFDTPQWGETSVELLKNPEIQSAVANYAVDELYANVDVNAELKKLLPGDLKDLSGIAAGGLRQVADQGAKKALETSQVQAAWQKANETAHKALIDVLEDRSDVLRTSGGQVQLELRPLIIEIASQVGLQKQAEQNIPASVGNIHIVDSEELATAQQVTKLIHGTALISSLLAMVLLGLAVFLSPGYRWMTFIWLGVALIIAAAIVLILRPVAGDIVVERLAAVEIQPAARAAWDIGTELLHSIAWTVIWSAVVLFAVAFLVSPARPAESTRRFLAVPFGRFPVPVFGLLAIVAFVFLITGADHSRVFFLRLMIVILAGIGVWAFRRQLVIEYPDADLEGLRDFGDRAAGSARDLWNGPLRGFTRIFGSRGDEAGSGPAAPAPAVDAGGEPAAAPGAASEPVTEAIGESEPAPEAPPAPSGEAPTGVLPASTADRFELLERLGKLRDSGILSEEEFTAEKRRILGEDS